MSLRAWASPPVQMVIGGSLKWAGKAVQYCTQGNVSFFPSNADGTPAGTWVVTVGRAADWTAAAADVDLRDIFAGDLGTANTVAEFKSLAKATTVGQVSVARRNAINANLDALGVSRADFTLATPMWKVFQRVVSTCLEKDHDFGGGFNL